MARSFNDWLDTFIEEKELPMEEWEIKSPNGTTNLMGTEIVIEHIKIAPAHEKAKIKDVLVLIDFKNGDVNHFFKHLAGALAVDMV